MSTPTITLKNLKTAEFASHETTCFTATVYVDGARFCTVRNEGTGGPNCYDPINPKRQSCAALYDSIREVGGRINPNAAASWDEASEREKRDGGLPDFDSIDWDERYSVSPYVHRHGVFDWYVDRALDRALALKEMKSVLSRRWVFRKPGHVGLFEIQKQRGHKAPAIEAEIQRRYPGAIVLNAISFDDAFAIWGEA